MDLSRNLTWFRRSGSSAKGRSLTDRAREQHSLFDTIGAYADRALLVGNVTATASSTTLTITGGTFPTTIVGKVIVIPNAGAETSVGSGVYYSHAATVTARGSSTSVTLSAAPISTYTTGAAYYGTDCGPAINTAAAQAVAAGVKLIVPGGNYFIATTVALPVGVQVEFQNAKFWGALTSAPILLYASSVNTFGKLNVDGSSLSGIVGVQLGADGINCEQARADEFDIDNCGTGLLFYSSGGTGNSCYHNNLSKVRARHCVTAGIRFFHDSVNGTGSSPFRVNANWITHASIQNNSGAAGVVVDGGDDNTFGKLEAEANTGASTIAVNLLRCFGFGILSGWLEGNTYNYSLADYPAVAGTIKLHATCDSVLNSTDTKFIHNFSSQRSIQTHNGKLTSIEQGRSRVAGLQTIGKDGTAASDQGSTGAFKLAVSGGIEGYRVDGTTNNFSVKVNGAATTSFIASLYDGTTLTSLLDASRTRLALPGALSIGNATLGNSLIYVLRTDAVDTQMRLAQTNAAGSALLDLDRGSDLRQACVRFYTANALVWSEGLMYNSGASSLDYHISTDATVTGSKLRLNSSGNLGIAAFNSFANGVKVLGLPDATTSPTTGPSGGTVIFSVSGGLRFRGNDGEKRLDYLLASATVDPASLTTGSQTTIATISTTGAVMGDLVIPSFSLDLQGLRLHAWVSAANTVSYIFRNDTGSTVDLASGTLRVQVWRP